MGGGYFTADTRHMLYGDDGSETRLSITGRPQSTGPRPIPHPLSGCGDTTGKMKGLFFPKGDYIKNVWTDVRVWESCCSVHCERTRSQECPLVNDKIGYIHERLIKADF